MDFAGSKTIDEVDVFSVQDNYASPVEPTAGMTFTRYGLVDFTVQYWDGTQWLAVTRRNRQWKHVGVASAHICAADDDEDSRVDHGDQ